MGDVTISAEREALIYGDGWGVAHVLTDRAWTPRGLGFVERRVLAERLRAIADLIEQEAMMATAPAPPAARGADGGAS